MIMDIVPIVTKDNLSKEQIEYLQKQQTEYKLINKIKRNPGHILFSFNRKTGEIKRASIIHKVAIGLNGLPVTKTETVIEPDCYYEQALNEKNFRIRLILRWLLTPLWFVLFLIYLPIWYIKMSWYYFRFSDY